MHFVLFGSDTLDVWLAQANKHLKPVASTTEESTPSHASPAKDESSPMDDTPNAEAGKDNSYPMEGVSQPPPAQSDASPMLSKLQEASVTGGQPSTLGGLAASQPASDSKATDGGVTQGSGGAEQGESVQTLTGVKVGDASEAPLEALGAPEVLEAAPPANDAALPGHSGSQDALHKGKEGAVSGDMGKAKATL